MSSLNYTASMEDRQWNLTVVVVFVVDLLCNVLLLQNAKMFSGFDIYRTHLLHIAFSLDKDVVYPHPVYNENTTLFPYCRKNGCTVPKWTFLSLSCCSSRKGNSASRVFLFRVQDYSKFLFQLFDVFYFKPSNRRINPLNTERPAFLDVSKPEAKRKVRHFFMLSSEFSVLDYNVNVKVHRNLFTDNIRTENKTLSYYRQKIH